MGALTKAEIATSLSDCGKIKKQEAKKFVDDFFALVSRKLIEGYDLKLSGFGVFYLREKNERIGRNPKTGKEVPITARRVVTFRPGQKLRAEVEKNCIASEQ